MAPTSPADSSEAVGRSYPGSGIVKIWVAACSQALRVARGGRLTTYRDRYWIACLLSALPCRLAWLLHLFGSDKQGHGEHAYGPTYHAIFRQLRYRNIKFLEIGVLDGASLLAWRAFFPRATIVGCDIEPKEQFSVGRINTLVADQFSSRHLAATAQRFGPFNIVIDDGSHKNKHQIFTFYEMFDRLSSDGIYVIEDVQTSFWPGHFGGAGIGQPEFQQTCVYEFLELSKYVNHNEFRDRNGLDERRLEVAKRIKSITFEHNLIIIQRGPNDFASNYERLSKAHNEWKDMT